MVMRADFCKQFSWRRVSICTYASAVARCTLFAGISLDRDGSRSWRWMQHGPLHGLLWQVRRGSPSCLQDTAFAYKLMLPKRHIGAQNGSLEQSKQNSFQRLQTVLNVQFAATYYWLATTDRGKNIFPYTSTLNRDNSCGKRFVPSKHYHPWRGHLVL